MNDLLDDILILLVRDLLALARELELFPGVRPEARATPRKSVGRLRGFVTDAGRLPTLPF